MADYKYNSSTPARQIVESIAREYPNAKSSGSGYKIPCPSHNGEHPNCYINEGDNGGIVLKCWSNNCSYESIAETLGIAPNKREPHYMASYENRDGIDRHTYRKAKAGGKDTWGKGSAKGCLLLPWGIDKPESVLCIVEGEKAAAALQGHKIKGMTAVSWRGGTELAKFVDTRLVKNRKVILWPDDDSPGRKAMAEIKNLCLSSGAQKIKIVETGGETKQDAADYDKKSTIDLLQNASAIELNETQELDWQYTTRGDISTRSVINAELAIKGVTDSIRLNLFSNTIEIDGEPIDDAQTYIIRRAVEQAYGFTPSIEAVQAGGSNAAVDNAYDPVVEWLDGLHWDGRERLYNMATLYFGHAQESQMVLYWNQVAALLIRGIVSRQYQPGIPFDYCVILRSTSQGTGKSRSLRAIAGDGFYSGSFSLDSFDLTKTTLEKSRGKLVVASEEMAGTRRSESEKVKSIITEVSDTSRMAYGRHTLDVKRRFIFAATSNEVMVLSDRSGNRRFPILEVLEADLEGMERDRDQIFAEAVQGRRKEPVSLPAEWRDFQQTIEGQYMRVSELEEWLIDTLEAIKESNQDRPIAIERKLLRSKAKESVRTIYDLEWSNLLRQFGFSKKMIRSNDGLRRYRAWVQKGDNPVTIETPEFPL